MSFYIKEPARPQGFYFLKRGTDLIVGEYAPYSNEDAEERHYDENPDAEPDQPVIDYGWNLDFSGRGVELVYEDSYFDWIEGLTDSKPHKWHSRAGRRDDQPGEQKQRWSKILN